MDDEPAVRRTLAEHLAGRRMRIHEAGSLAEARGVLEKHARIDLALVDLSLPDGDGLELADELAARRPRIPSIIITGRPDLDRAVRAIRAGVEDFLAKPLEPGELDRGVERALSRRRRDRQQVQRLGRLRRLCRKLHRDRTSVSEQVDILCNDLVTAYEELAGQMKHMELTTRFRAMVEQELDLELLLRRTLEFLLEQTGPTNAVIFLPGVGGGYTVGGYINYTFSRADADVLLDHLAERAAPRIVEAEQRVHLTDEAEINLWLSDECAWLADSHLIGLPCRHEGETLASVLLFRSAAEPYEPETVDSLEQVASVFAAQLVKVISIHHRHLQHDEEEEGEDDSDGGLGVSM